MGQIVTPAPRYYKVAFIPGKPNQIAASWGFRRERLFGERAPLRAFKNKGHKKGESRAAGPYLRSCLVRGRPRVEISPPETRKNVPSRSLNAGIITERKIEDKARGGRAGDASRSKSIIDRGEPVHRRIKWSQPDILGKGCWASILPGGLPGKPL